MTQYVSDAKIFVYHPGDDTSSGTAPSSGFTASQSNIATLSFDRRIGHERDQGTVRIDNHDNQLGDSAFQYGDRVAVETQEGSEGSRSRKFTGFVTEHDIAATGRGKVWVEAELEGFTRKILATRTVTNGFDATQAAGSSDSILNTIIANNASELTRSGISTVSDTLTIDFSAENLLEACHAIERRTGGRLASDDTTVNFDDPGATGLESEVVTVDDFLGAIRTTTRGDDLANRVRIQAGQGSAKGPKQETQTQLSTYGDADNSNHKTQDVPSPYDRNRVIKGEVYLGSSNTSDDAIVRLQKDAGSGSAVAPADRDRDLARDRIPASDVTSDGYYEFPDLDGEVPDDFVIIVESNSSNGVEVGEDGSGNLTYRLFYPITLDVDISNDASVNRYRRHEGVIDRRDQPTQQAAEESARAELNRKDEPHKQIIGEADSDYLHNSAPGDVHQIDITTTNTTGAYVVASVKHEYEDTHVFTNLRFHRVSSL